MPPKANGGDGGDIGAFEFGGVSIKIEITSIVRFANGNIHLQGTGVASGLHTIEATLNLNSGSFVPVGKAAADSSGVWKYDDAPTSDLTKRFYRATYP